MPSLTTTPRLKMSQYRSAKDIYAFTTQPKNNKKPEESPQKSIETIICDLENHYQDLDHPAREYALVRDLVNDWNDRRLLALWKCFEHHPRRTFKVIGVMGLDFGEARMGMVIRGSLRNLQKHPQKDRFLVVARALHQSGNGDSVLGLEDPQYVLNCRDGSDNAM
ncbi:hypothetical protein BM1_01345 [Bipolaris maydis]|nr:hypothetical protein BM1_01345 [Bipolaris maydis]